ASLCILCRCFADQALAHGLGQAEPAVTREAAAEVFVEPTLVHVRAGAFAEQTFGQGFAHFFDEQRREQLLEALRSFGAAAVLLQLVRAFREPARRSRARRRAVYSRMDSRGEVHHIVLISATSSPPWDIACRMLIMSRGVVPRTLST